MQFDSNFGLVTSSPIVQVGSGSGLIANLTNGGIEIVTNKHVLVDSSLGTASACFFEFPEDTSLYAGNDSVSSVQVDSNGYDVGYFSGLKQLGNTGYSKSIAQRASTLRVCHTKATIGDPVVIIGYPDYGNNSGQSFFKKQTEVTATEGIISGFDGDYYTTSAKIEPGNSGGLAIDENRNCYLGIPSSAVVGDIESLGRILPVSLFLK